nr:alpha/beta hydrolase fold domain-containing protein [Pseudonocardia sp. H11422]
MRTGRPEVGSPPSATTCRFCASAGLPPTHVVVGTDEILLVDTNALVTAVEKAGGKITCRRDAGMWHDHLVFAGMLREADEAMAELGTAIRTDCAG